MELSLETMRSLIIFLFFPFIGGYLARRFKLPSLVGYIISGIVMGALFRDGLTSGFLNQFASIGIIFLLFAVGLELNLNTLGRFRRFIFSGGVLQIFITELLIFVLALAFRMSLVEAIIIAFSFALSSTAIVAKILEEKNEDNSLVGDLGLGILIFQDLAAIPLIIIIDSLSPNLTILPLLQTIAVSILRAGFILATMYLIGAKFMPKVFTRIAKTSREILNLFTIFFIVLMVYLFTYLGLSASIAAFIAGLLVGRTLQHYHIFSQIRPLRDLFAVMFFVSIGAQIKLTSVIGMLPMIILFTVLLMFIKWLVVTIIFIRFKFHTRTAFSLGILLSQVGEFAFIILSLGFAKNLISESTYLFGLTSVLITIGISPIAINGRDHIYQKFRKVVAKFFPDLSTFLTYAVDQEAPHIDLLDLKNHVILCGYGRVGKYIGRALSMAQISYIAIDYNYLVVVQARSQGVNIIYGDPTDLDILTHAQADKAFCIISALPGQTQQEMVILNAKSLNPKVVIFSRVARENQQRRLRDLGAEIVIQPEFEASLSIIKKIFHEFKIPKDEIVGKIRRLKLEHGMM